MAKGSLDNVLTVLRRNGFQPENFDLHINFPGGTPIDGPSAGVAMAVAIASAMTKTPVDNKLAMTGEVSIHGNVKPVGGVHRQSGGRFSIRRDDRDHSEGKLASDFRWPRRRESHSGRQDGGSVPPRLRRTYGMDGAEWQISELPVAADAFAAAPAGTVLHAVNAASDKSHRRIAAENGRVNDTRMEAASEKAASFLRRANTFDTMTGVFEICSRTARCVNHGSEQTEKPFAFPCCP